MKAINRNKANNIMSSSAEERYNYFIRKVADFQEVWGLYNEGWAMLADNKEQTIIPFWPEEAFAKLCVGGAWENYEPKKIELNIFLEKWLPGMRNDGKFVGIFYNTDGKGIVVQPDKLLENIQEELDQY
jgi:hypothetical protein